MFASLPAALRSSARRREARLALERALVGASSPASRGPTHARILPPSRGYAAGVARERTAVTTRLWQARLEAARAAGVDTKDAATKPQDALVPKPPVRTSVRYAFNADDDLLESYRNPWNAVRMGRVLEDLDSLAGNIAFQHCDDADRSTRPQLLVTASVDRVRLLRQLRLDQDVILSGAVAWTGRSSMIIRMEAWPANHPDAPSDPQHVASNAHARSSSSSSSSSSSADAYARGSGPSLSADFTFVARDPLTNRAAALNPLVPDTPETRALFEETARRVERKKRRAKTLAAGDAGLSESLAADKASFVEERARRSRSLSELPALAPPDVISVAATLCENIFVAQPQQRNLSGRIFGGFLLRRAFELAFATTYVFGGARPYFKQVSDMNFLKPVDVGDLLRFRARVLDANAAADDARPCVDVEVEALVTKPEEGSSEVSNTFMFKFYVGGAGEGRVARTPLPATREEAAHVWERCRRPKLDPAVMYDEA
jgi:acyl-coenzyme A thioesterase 9